MKKWYVLGVLWLISLCVTGCAASANSDGSCKRTCGNRPIGGGNLKVYAQSSPETWKCAAGAILPTRTFKFLVVEETSSAASTTYDSTKDIPKTIPVAGIAFTAEGLPYGTFNTPSSELCTDSCGYAAVTFTPECVTQDVMVSIIVPGSGADESTSDKRAIKFAVTTE